MKLQTKTQIAKTTFSLLIISTIIFLLGTLVFVFCIGLGLNPFKQATSVFLMTAFVGLIGIVAVLVLFNVATNISLITDIKIANTNLDQHSKAMTKWIAAFVITAISLILIIYFGTYLSKEKYLSLVHSQAHEVLKENESLLDNIGILLRSGKVEDFIKLYDIRKFLENQRQGLPHLKIIYSGDFDGKLAFYEIGSYFRGNLEKNTYSPTYFKCTKDLDCNYLKRFFSGQDVSILQKFTFRDDQFYIYIPYTKNGSRFILLFYSNNTYGKLGS